MAIETDQEQHNYETPAAGPSSAYTDNELLDCVIAKLQLVNDNQLSTRLAIDHDNLSRIRSGNRNLSPLQKIKCYDALGFPWAKVAFDTLFPDESPEGWRPAESEEDS